MKKIIAILCLMMSFEASATMECTGRSAEGNFVTVMVNTYGVKSKAESGTVQIFDGINHFGYTLAAVDITQYYERALFDSQQTFVGLAAYVAGENPIDIFYSGENFADQDLKAVIEAPGRKKITGSQMIVWKGPGYAATEQYQMDDFACGVTSDF